MGLKDDVAPDEWENLVRLPYAVSMAVMMAAPNLLGIWSETRAMLQQPAGLAAASGSSLVGLVSAEAQARAGDLAREQQDAWRSDQAGYRARVLEASRAAARALEKVPAGEAEAYRRWVLGIGEKVAEAAKEKGVAVSDPERAALAEVSAALGVGGA